jgi:hypothetical protein
VVPSSSHPHAPSIADPVGAGAGSTPPYSGNPHSSTSTPEYGKQYRKNHKSRRNRKNYKSRRNRKNYKSRRNHKSRKE